MNLGKIGEYIAVEFLRERGYLVWKPEEFIKILELTAVYYAVDGVCSTTPREPLTFSVSTPVGYISLTLWRDRCLDVEGKKAMPFEYIHLPCVKKCIERDLGPLIKIIEPIFYNLLTYRSLLKTIDLFAYRDGVIYAVEVKTNSGTLSKTQIEKTLVLKGVRHLLLRVYLTQPFVEIKHL